MDDDKAAKLQAQLQALSKAYASQLPEKIRQIEETWDGLQNEWNDDTFQTLHRMVHSLTGSGTTFGFTLLSEVAGMLEALIKGLLAEGKTPPCAAHRDDIADCLKALGNASLHPDSKSTSKNEAASGILPGAANNRLVFLVDDDVQLAENLSLQLGYFGYTTRAFSTLSDALLAIIESPPAVLLLDVAFPEDSLGGFSLLERINREIGHALPAIFISVHSELEYRLKAVRAGGCAYFTKPLEVSNLIDKMEELTFREHEDPYRILLVDDSRLLAETYAAILKNAGMETQIVTEPLTVMEPLLEFMPDLILMDVYMPDCSGLELAKVIRQQERFVSIPIVFLSAETDMEKQLDAMSLGGDDFLTKSIRPGHLVSSVTTRVRRSRVLRSFMVRDSLTGLLNHTTIKAQLDTQLARIKRLGGALSFAMLDIDHFKAVNDTYGHPTGDRVIRSLSRLLQQRLRRSDVVGRYGGEEFAVIFNDTDGAAAVKVLDEIRRDFGLIRHRHEKGEFSVTISAGVSGYPAINDAATLNEAADKALYEAKNGGRNRVILFRG